MVPEPKVIEIRLQVGLHLDVTVVLVSAVVADRIAEQATARADGDPFGRLGMAGGLGRDTRRGERLARFNRAGAR